MRVRVCARKRGRQMLVAKSVSVCVRVRVKPSLSIEAVGKARVERVLIQL